MHLHWRRFYSSLSTTAVRIVEVGPRDGLQNEKSLLNPRLRADLIRKLADSGLRWIEAGSFVSPKWVPQMAGTKEVLELLSSDSNIKNMSSLRLPVLIPNMKGYEEAIKSPMVREVAVFTAASESFTKRNLNATIKESLQQISEICTEAKKDDCAVRGYISTVISCPYEGSIDPVKVKEIAQELLALGCYEVSLGDTIGTGTAGSVRLLLTTLMKSIDPSRLAVHFHDTYGQALANILVALELGVRTIDASVAGLGGCPFAPGATGNVATEDVIYLLQGLDYFSGIDLEKLVDAGDFITKSLQISNQSRAAKALLARRKTV